MEVRLKLVLKIDAEEYPIPADEYVIPELKDYIEDMFADIDGVTILKIQPHKNNQRRATWNYPQS